MSEERIGKVMRYFAKIGVAAIRMEAILSVGETIHIQGHTTDFTQQVDSIQIENQGVEKAGPGADVGIKVDDRVREHDIVYKVTDNQ
jgi:putative protease